PRLGRRFRACHCIRLSPLFSALCRETSCTDPMPMKPIIPLLLLLMAALPFSAPSPFPTSGPEILYIGTYSDQGLFVVAFDRANGSFRQVQALDFQREPSFQALHPTRRFLYSVSAAPAE